MKTKLTPGRYRMTWCGYSQCVTVFWKHSTTGHGTALYFCTASGWDHAVATVPDATWEAVQ